MIWVFFSTITNLSKYFKYNVDSTHQKAYILTSSQNELSKALNSVEFISEYWGLYWKSSYMYIVILVSQASVNNENGL